MDIEIDNIISLVERLTHTQLVLHIVVLEISCKVFHYFCIEHLHVFAIMRYIQWQNNGIGQGHGYLSPDPCSHLVVFKLRVDKRGHPPEIVVNCVV